jgi:hypothetical protein
LKECDDLLCKGDFYFSDVFNLLAHKKSMTCETEKLIKTPEQFQDGRLLTGTASLCRHEFPSDM